MASIAFEGALFCYLAAAIAAIAALFRDRRETPVLVIAITAAGFVFHTVSIITRFVNTGHVPTVSMHEASSFFSWCILIVFFFIQVKYRIGVLAAFVLPLVFILMLSSSMLPREIRPLSPVLQSYWLGIHTTLAFLGNAAFATACGIGIMYLLQDHFLKKKHLGGLFRKLPSIQILDEINHRLITIGFPLLTLAIITGALWAESSWGSYWRWDPKEVWSLITWLLYALVLHIRAVAGWRGRKAAILSITGFCMVLFTFYGVNFLLKSIHIFP